MIYERLMTQAGDSFKAHRAGDAALPRRQFLKLGAASGFALGMVPKSSSGLSVGLFFGGLSGAIAIFGYLVPKSAALALPHVLGLAALACICASSTIASGRYLRKLQS